MNTKTLSPHALSVIDQYTHFKVGEATCTIPYFNNKTTKAKAALAVRVGKGSPKEISDEIKEFTHLKHIPTEILTNESLKKILTDNNIGIDCSGFAYYVLNAENKELGKGTLDKHIHFTQSHGLFGKILSRLSPVKNIGVATFADDANSRIISVQHIQPGDMITMIGDSEEFERDHILIIHRAEYQNFIPTKIYYSHAIAYPEDGIYGTGIKEGMIEITDLHKSITEQRWTENNTTNEQNHMCVRARKSNTQIRRLKWW